VNERVERPDGFAGAAPEAPLRQGKGRFGRAEARKNGWQWVEQLPHPGFQFKIG